MKFHAVLFFSSLRSSIDCVQLCAKNSLVVGIEKTLITSWEYNDGSILCQVMLHLIAGKLMRYYESEK